MFGPDKYNKNNISAGILNEEKALKKSNRKIFFRDFFQRKKKFLGSLRGWHRSGRLVHFF
jgi:hypothetical protein